MITFAGPNQEAIAGAATNLVSSIERSLPRVPWLSNSGQQEAFRKIVALVDGEVDRLEADADAKNAILFWALTLLYASQRSFRLAIASVKNFGFASSPVASTFVSWVGENTHPGEVVMQNIESWRS